MELTVYHKPGTGEVSRVELPQGSLMLDASVLNPGSTVVQSRAVHSDYDDVCIHILYGTHFYLDTSE
jgi:hypothetical protein